MHFRNFFPAATCVAIFSLGLLAARAQTQAYATWSGASGGEWNTAANWSTAVVPGNDANATTNVLIGTGTSVNYNLPMAAASFGLLTNNGTLNINTNGFNCSGIYALLTSGVDTVNMTNSGCVVNDYGAFQLGTNGQATLGVGASLSCFSLTIGANTTSHAPGTSTFTNNGGNISTTSTAVNSSGSTETTRFIIFGGTNNLGKTSVGRYSASSASTLGTEGLAIYGGVVTMTNLTLSAGSFGTAYIDGGTVTNIATAVRSRRVSKGIDLFRLGAVATAASLTRNV